MIKVYSPLLSGNEKKYLCEAIDEGEVSSGGRFVSRFEDAFAEWSGNKFAVAVSSGTAALETAIWAMDLKEISIPSGTIISCYNAAVRAGAIVHLHDNVEVMAENLMRAHLFGGLDTSTGLKVVEDLSQYWQPFKVEDVGCYSLYANKTITSGEGGVVVTNNIRLWERAKSYRNLCHSSERFVHEQMGYNFRMSNLQAAVALAQLERIDDFIAIKQRNRDLYFKYLPTDIKALFKVDVPWMYLVGSDKPARELVWELHRRGIECRRFFYPIHRQPFLNGKYPGLSCPIADKLWEHTFYIPSGLNLTEKDIEHVSETIREIL